MSQAQGKQSLRRPVENHWQSVNRAAPRLLTRLKPKPVVHVAGENDPLVKFSWQKQTMDAVRKLNQCGEGQPWEGEKAFFVCEMARSEN